MVMMESSDAVSRGKYEKGWGAHAYIIFTITIYIYISVCVYVINIFDIDIMIFCIHTIVWIDWDGVMVEFNLTCGHNSPCRSPYACGPSSDWTGSCWIFKNKKGSI